MSGSVPQTLTGKVAIVTGSSRGIGAAIAIRLAQHGANLVVNYANSLSAAEKVVKTIQSYGVDAIAVKADVSKPAEVNALFDAAKAKFGRIDIVMSNSGIEHFGDLPEVSEEEIDKVLGTNVKAQFVVAQNAYKHMENNGRLILISSISAVLGFGRHALYGASKAAIQGMVRSLAWDFGPRQITVNCIAPGGVKTDMYAEAAAKYIKGGEKMSVEEIDQRISDWSPFGRPGFPDDIAGVVAMFASPESQWLTGQTVHASGGSFMI